MINPLLIGENAGNRTDNVVILYLPDLILPELPVPLSLASSTNETIHSPPYPTWFPVNL